MAISTEHDSLEPYQHEGSNLYGRRKGKKLRQYHEELVEHLLPKLRIDVAKKLDISGRDPAKSRTFAANCTSFQLEIGFGGAEHLISQAKLNPDVGYLGCEPFINGVAKALAAIDGEHIDNIRLYDGDAALLLNQLPDACLDRVYLLYPDPWPKRRQRKRRFVSEQNLARIARVLKPGCELRFATDIDDYAGWTLARILASPDFVWQPKTSDDWQKPWAGWESTRYEEKAFREGRVPAYFRFVRV